MKTKIIQYIPVLLLLIIICLQEFISIRHKTFTADEEDHYGYGWNILMGDADSRIVGNGTLMPFNAVNALPRYIGRKLPSGPIRNFLVEKNTGRYITILGSLILALYIFKWAKDLYGFRGGYFSMLLFAFSPNLIAHSRLITNDIFATTLMTLSLYYFWRFLKHGGWKKATLTAALVGISQIAKYSCISLYPIMTVITLFRYCPELILCIRKKHFRELTRRTTVFLCYYCYFILITLLFINIGFLFNRTFTPLKEYTFESRFFQNLQFRAGILSEIPLPLPVPYLEGPDSRQWETETGEHGNNYLFGELRNPEYFRGYYFLAAFFKVPIAIQLFIIFSLISYLINRRRFNFLTNESFLWIPIILLSFYINFFPTIQSGLRYYLIIFPLLLIFCGNLVVNWNNLRVGFKILILILIFYLVTSVLSYFPHYLSYFNELVWNRKLSYRILADSNLEWGQNRWYVEKYLSEHPEVERFPSSPRPGCFILPANKLVGIFRPWECRWLRNNFEPVDHVAYSHLIFEVSPEELKRALDREENRENLGTTGSKKIDRTNPD